MAARRENTRTTTQTGRTSAQSSSAVSRERYPQWKVELFRTGISERRQSASGQMSGRATRAPGA
jgi:hypothetical protein